MKHYYLALDQGTTGTTALLIDSDTLTLHDKVNQEFPQIFPAPGQVEHNLNDIWNSVESVVTDILKKNSLSSKNIKTIGITNQRETTCAFNNQGKPLANAIVWQDRRTEKFCQELKDKNHEEKIKKTTGLTLDPYFSGTKMHWLINNDSKVQEASKKQDLKFGTIDTFLLFKLTSGSSYYTEASNASRTLLMDLSTGHWNDDLLNIFSVKKEYLPQIKSSFGDFGETKGLSFLEDGIPITGILGDQQAALFGQAGFNEGGMKCTYGTGAFLLLNTGNKIKYSHNGLLTTVAYQEGDKLYYALEGSSYIAGAAVQWLRDNLKSIKSSPEVEVLAKKVENLKEMENILFLPFFTGIGSPHWISHAKAALIGLTRDSENKHIARACLEGVTLSINYLIEAMEKDFGNKISSLKVDGGACANNFFMQLQSDFSNLEVIRPKLIETTGFGAACAAAIGIGDRKKEEILNTWKKDQRFSPEKNNDYFSQKKSQWSEWIQKLYK